MKISIDQIKKLRGETGAGVADVKKALEEAGGDEKRAKQILREQGFAKASQKAGRETKTGWIFSYVHHSGRVGAILALECETDFVARNEEFQKLGREIVMQIASMSPKDVKELLSQEYIRDSGKTVGNLLQEAVAKTGENIQIGEIGRFEV